MDEVLGDIMSHAIANGGLLLMYTLSGISGAIGGCAAASHSVFTASPQSREQMLPLGTQFIGYGIFGLFTALIGVAFDRFLFFNVVDVESAIASGLTLGFIGALSLGVTNLSMRFLLKRLGIEVTLNVKRKKGNKDE